MGKDHNGFFVVSKCGKNKHRIDEKSAIRLLLKWSEQ